MNWPLILLWILASWVLIIHWLPDPPPDWMTCIIGIVGGVAGGYLFNMAWPGPAESVIGVVVGAGFVVSIMRMFMGGKMAKG